MDHVCIGMYECKCMYLYNDNKGLGTCNYAAATETCVGDLLNAFNTWRENTNNIGPHDDAQLFSSRDFSGYSLGYASVSALCVYSRSSGVNMTPPSQSQAFSSSVVAHELGHNLGSCAMPRTARLMLTNLIRSLHDNSANTCPVSGYIMNSQVPCVHIHACMYKRSLYTRGKLKS